MENDLELDILSSKRFIAELEDRLKNKHNWSDGELIIFKRKMKNAKEKLSNLYRQRDDQEFNS